MLVSITEAYNVRYSVSTYSMIVRTKNLNININQQFIAIHKQGTEAVHNCFMTE